MIFQKYNNDQQQIIEELLEGYMNNVNINGLEEATEQVKETILLMLDEDLQQDILSIVSQFYFTFSFCEDTENFLVQRGKLKDKFNKWWTKFDDCMKKPKDWNPVDWAICL